MGFGVADGVAAGVGSGVGSGVGLGVGSGVGASVGASVGVRDGTSGVAVVATAAAVGGTEAAAPEDGSGEPPRPIRRTRGCRPR